MVLKERSPYRTPASGPLLSGSNATGCDRNVVRNLGALVPSYVVAKPVEQIYPSYHTQMNIEAQRPNRPT